MKLSKYFNCFAFFLGFSSLLFSPLQVYADIASASNAVHVEDMTDLDLDDLEDLEFEEELEDLEFDEELEDLEDDEYYEEDVETFDESLLVPYLEDIGGLVADIHAEIVPSEVPDQGYYSVMSIDDDEVSAFALSDDFGIDNNVIIYEGTWGGTSYRAVFPAQYEQYLIVTDEGYLYNLSGSAVTGRLFQDEVDYLEYEYSSLVLNSVLGNVSSTIYNYGYPSYVRRYYESNNRITNTDTYGLFRVDNVVRTDSGDPNRISNNYLLILMMIGGMQLLCFMKKSHQ